MSEKTEAERLSRIDREILEMQAPFKNLKKMLYDDLIKSHDPDAEEYEDKLLKMEEDAYDEWY